MGKIFLLLILVGLVYGGYAVYQNISDLQDPESLRSRYQGAEQSPEVPVGEDSAEPIKTPPVPSSEQVLLEKPDAEPLPVVASSSEWILIEAWDVVRAGEELPDGSVLESWTSSSATVRTPSGQVEKVRFRRFGEAMAKAATAVATLAAEPVTVSPWSQTKPAH